MSRKVMNTITFYNLIIDFLKLLLLCKKLALTVNQTLRRLGNQFHLIY